MPESEKEAEDLREKVVELAQIVVGCWQAGEINAANEAERRLEQLKMATEALCQKEAEHLASQGVRDSSQREAYVVRAPVRVSKCESFDCELWATWRVVYPHGATPVWEYLCTSHRDKEGLRPLPS